FFLARPFSVTACTGKLLADQQARTIGDVVQNDPSVRNDGSPVSQRDAFFIRAFSVVALDPAFDSLFCIAN
ncbi:TonB-dependent receptor plug domain-containing protein, partial [Stenotrophomonas maltophilia]|uniref:TonB-dependent receptor plug domain-containing protein n=1 Tax=Stenotrophomonas maltophilia TaxID=40324 RepID=UPI0013DA4830